MAKQKGRSLLTAIPIGTNVRMVNCLETENPKNQHDWITASETWELCGNWVVLLEGYRGGFSLNKLERVE